MGDLGFEVKKLIMAAAALLAVAGCAGPVTADMPPPVVPETFMVLGSVNVSKFVSADYEDGTPCTSDGGFTDIAEGAQVTVLSAEGTKLAVGALQAGVFEGFHCRFDFEVDGIPEGESLYDVTVGRESRGAVTFSRDQLGSAVRLSL